MSVSPSDLLAIATRALSFGLIGIVLECFFTGLKAFWNGDKNATCQTYLWMVPIYGLTALGLEHLNAYANKPFYIMACYYTAVIYLSEFLSGWVLKRFTGKIPWDYGKNPGSVYGYINWHYFPYWFAIGLAFNRFSRFLHKLTKVLLESISWT
jgi:uncharacterized membrane protein